MHRIVVATCALMLLAGTAAAAIDNAGTTAGNFLSVGTGASVLSMGGATLGRTGDLHAAAWNPAALARIRGTEFALAHGGLADQQSQEWAAAAGRLGASSRWAFTALYQGESGFEGRDALGAATGSFSVSNTALGVTFAHAFGDRLSVGVGSKYVSESLGSTSGSALAFDAGVQLSAGAFGVGLAARNMGGKMKYDTGTYDLPSTFGAGVAWQHATSGVRLALDANFPKAYYNDVRMGAEWLWQDRVALRAGYRMELGAAAAEATGGPAFGVGTGVNGVWVDYGFVGAGEAAQSQHRLGLSFRPARLGNAMGATTQPSLGETEAPAREPKAAKPAREPKPEKVATVKPEKPAKAPKPAKAAKAEAPLAVRPLESDAAEATPKAERAPKPAKAPKAEKPSKPEKPAATESPAASAPAIVLPAGVTEASADIPSPRAKAPAKKKLKASDSVKAPATAKPEEPVTATSEAPAVATPPAPAKPVVVEPKVEKPAEPAKPVVPAVRPVKIVVQAGETLADLAKRWDTSVARLMMENNLVSESVKPGKALKLPPAGQR